MRKYVYAVIAVLLLVAVVLIAKHLTGQIKNERTRSAELEESLRMEIAYSAELEDKLSAEQARSAELEGSLFVELTHTAGLEKNLSAERTRFAEQAEKLHVASRGYAELKETFRVFEWPVSVRTNGMVYRYVSTDGNTPRGAGGGIGIKAETSTIYIWPKEDTGQMALSMGGRSCVFFSDECGIHFRPVTPAPELVVGETIRLLEGYGPAKGKSLWIRIVGYPPNPTP